jgi:hypothetical protein
MNLGDAVPDLDDRTDFHNRHAGVEIFDLLTNDFVDFVCSDWFHRILCLTREFLT